MSADLDWLADLARYPRRPFLKEQSIWAIWVYRFGRRADCRPDGIIKSVLIKIYWVLFRLVETITGISLPKEVNVGPGLRIWHFGNIIVHPGASMGANCTLRQGVTIGNRRVGGPVPVIGDGVDFGAYAQVLGGVRVADHCTIGAMSVVLTDVSQGCTVVGVPARALPKVANSSSVSSGQ
jgi:serine O-acetyltransferase